MTAVMGEDSGTSTELAPERSATGATKPSVLVHACEVCGRVFGRRSNLSRHQRLHSGEKPFTCPECQRSFTHRSSLTHHLRLHTGERPYQCSLCPRTFRQRPNYTLHLKTHTGDKDYRCHTCGKEFAQRVHLTTHARLHSGDLPYACQDCGRRFPQRCHLTCHRDTRRGQAKHLCDSCDGRFFSRSCLATHKETHKGGTQTNGVKRLPSNVQEESLGLGRKRTKGRKVTWVDGAEGCRKGVGGSSLGQVGADCMTGKAVRDSTKGESAPWGDRAEENKEKEDRHRECVGDNSQGQKIVKDMEGKTVRDTAKDENRVEGRDERKDVGWDENRDRGRDRDHSVKGLDGEENRVKGKDEVWYRDRDKTVGEHHKKQGGDENMKGMHVGDKINILDEDNSDKGNDIRDRHRKSGMGKTEGEDEPACIGRGRKVQAVECEVCHKAFHKPSHLHHHRRTHSGEQPHQCPHCDRRFSHTRSLRRHLLALHIKAKLPPTHIHGNIRLSVIPTPNTHYSIPSSTSTFTPTQRDSGRISNTHLTPDKTTPTTTCSGHTPSLAPAKHIQDKLGECFSKVMFPHPIKNRDTETRPEEFLSTSNTCSSVGVGGVDTVEIASEVMSLHLTKNRGTETSLEELLSIPNTCSPLGVGGSKGSKCFGEDMSVPVMNNRGTETGLEELMSVSYTCSPLGMGGTKSTSENVDKIMPPPVTENRGTETSLEELLYIPNMCSSVVVEGTKKDECTNSSSGSHKTGVLGVHELNGTPTLQSVNLPLHMIKQPKKSETQRHDLCSPTLLYPSISTSQATTHYLTLKEDPEHKVIKTEVIGDANMDFAAGTREMDGLGKQESKGDHTRPCSFPLTAQPLVAVSLFLFGKRVKDETEEEEEIDGEGELSVKEEFEMVEEAV